MEFEGRHLSWKMSLLIICIHYVWFSYGCLDEERAALLQLKQQINYPKGTSLPSWEEGHARNCCHKWEGVTCEEQGRVISLSLVSVHISGEWHLNASVLLPFQELQELHMAFNSIVSWMEDKGFPKLTSSLQKLRLLDLRGNEFNSSILQQLSGFPSLEDLDLSSNWLQEEIELYELNALERLDLSNNNIESIIFHPNNGCGKMQKLRILNLNNNGLQSLPLCLGNLKSLQQLGLSSNQFAGDIPFLQNLTSLQTLDISDNSFSGNLPSWLYNMTTLQKLDVSANQFTGNIGLSPLVGLRSLKLIEISRNQFQIPYSFGSFANHTKLKYFIGDYNQVITDTKPEAQPLIYRFQLQALTLSNCAVKVLPLFLHHQHELMITDLSDNSLQGNFPAWLLDNNPQLDMVNLKNNSLSDLLQLPSHGHAHLSRLDISHNKIHGHIPENIGLVLPFLTVLDISNNEFTGDIPSSLCHIESLSEIYLSNNHLSGGLGQLTKNCSKLSVLSVSSNKLEGDLPSFHHLISLSFLDLHMNSLSASITYNMFNSNLNVLILSNNSLEGPISEGFCHLNALSFLDLSYNKLNGTLPSCLNSSQLYFLYLNNNRLSGQLNQMTLAFYSAPSLVTLDLRNNNFTGQIPHWIGNLFGLSALLLKGNRFDGEIPFQLCNLLDLTILDLSNNSLSGPIPPCLSKITFYGVNSPSILESIGYGETVDKVEIEINQAIQIFQSTAYYEDFQPDIGNRVDFITKSSPYTYSGYILQYMSGIDLSHNRLTGEIPIELGNMNELHSLNLSHNNLWGSIPPSFSNLTKIESLDLSNNWLSGSIPYELMALTFVEVFNVAYNNLSGRIPNEAQFSTFYASSYEGNPFLCGPPLPQSCINGGSPSIAINASMDELQDDDGLINMAAFSETFAVSSVTVFLMTVIVFLINAHWQRALFDLVKARIASGYHLLEDIRKL